MLNLRRWYRHIGPKGVDPESAGPEPVDPNCVSSCGVDSRSFFLRVLILKIYPVSVGPEEMF